MNYNIIKDGYKFLVDLVFINMLWLFVSALGFFITFGAATTAMFTVSFKLLNIDDQTYIVSSFFKSFKENLIISTLIWFFILLVATPLYFIYNYAINVDSTFLLLSVYFTAFELLLFTLYVFPIIARFESSSIFQLIKNTFYMANSHFFTTFKILGSLAFAMLLIVKVHSLFILIAIGIYSIFACFHLNKIFSIYIDKISSQENKSAHIV